MLSEKSYNLISSKRNLICVIGNFAIKIKNDYM